MRPQIRVVAVVVETQITRAVMALKIRSGHRRVIARLLDLVAAAVAGVVVLPLQQATQVG